MPPQHLEDDRDFDESPVYVEPLVDAALNAMLRNQEWSAFHSWLIEALPKFATPTGKALLNRSAEARAALAFLFGRPLWNAMPLPRLDYKPQIIPEPGRNDPCGCGSGTKYKTCCLRLGAAPDIDIDQMWPLLFVKLSPTQRAEALASRRVPFDPFLDYAYEQLGDDNPQQALDALLSIEDAVIARGDSIAATLMSALVQAYGDLDRIEDAQVMLQAVIANSPALRAKAYAHIATLEMDNDEPANAWHAYREAQRLQLETESLVDLEIILLAGEHRTEEARLLANQAVESALAAGAMPDDPRMQFLGRFLLADNDDEDSDADLLDDLIDELPGDFDDMDFTDEDDEEPDDKRLLRLHDWLNDSIDRPLPTPSYEIANADDYRRFGLEKLEPGAGQLVAPASVREVESGWRQIFNVALGDEEAAWDIEQCAAWLDYLDEHSNAFDSIAILDDIATAIGAHPQSGREQVDEDAVVVWRRSVALTKQAATIATDARLRFDFDLNDAALRSLALLCREEREFGDADIAIEYSELSLQLDPGDNFLLRGWLVNEYLLRGDNRHAAELTGHFIDDRFEQVCFGRALALFRLGQNDDAKTTLQRAHKQFPLVAQYLVAAKMHEPKPDLRGDIDFAATSAWTYRQEMRRAWLATPGAMELLGEVAR